MNDKIQKIVDRQQKIFKSFTKMIEQLEAQDEELLSIYDYSKNKIKEYERDIDNTMLLMEKNRNQIKKLKQLTGEEYGIE